MLIYVLAFPIGLFWALHKNRLAIYDKAAPDHERAHRWLGPFADQYEPKYYYFEVLVILRKLLLTGLVRLIAPGSPPQIMIALLVYVAYMCLVLKTAPFEEDLDDWLSFITECQLSLTMFIGFAILTDTNRILHRGVLDQMLVVVNCCGFVAFMVGACIQSKAHEKVQIVRQRVRRVSMNIQFGGLAAMSAGDPESGIESRQTTKVMPRDGSNIQIVSPAAALRNGHEKGGLSSGAESDFTLPAAV